MCNRCPHVAQNININLGHICILVLFDYAEWRTWWFRAISQKVKWRWYQQWLEEEKRFFGGIFLVFVVQISGTDRCLSHAQAAIYPLLLPVFIIFFGWVSLWRRGSEQPDSPPWKHLQLENRAAHFLCQKPAVNSFWDPLTYTQACTVDNASTRIARAH